MSEHKPELKDAFPFLFSKTTKLDELVDEYRAGLEKIRTLAKSVPQSKDSLTLGMIESEAARLLRYMR